LDQDPTFTFDGKIETLAPERLKLTRRPGNSETLRQKRMLISVAVDVCVADQNDQNVALRVDCASLVLDLCNPEQKSAVRFQGAEIVCAAFDLIVEAVKRQVFNVNPDVLTRIVSSEAKEFRIRV
jgi:hypothetical protein